MRIGIDVDDTLAATIPALLKRIEYTFGLHYTIEDVTEWVTLEENTGLSNQQVKSVLHEAWENWQQEIKPISVAAIRKMQEMSSRHEFYIITHRGHATHPEVAEWLRHWHVPYDGLLFLKKSKMGKEYMPMEVWVDDRPQDFHWGVNLWVPKYPWNSHLVLRPNTKYVANLLDALERIDRGESPCVY